MLESDTENGTRCQFVTTLGFLASNSATTPTTFTCHSSNASLSTCFSPSSESPVFAKIPFLLYTPMSHEPNQLCLMPCPRTVAPNSTPFGARAGATAVKTSVAFWGNEPGRQWKR
ncbi:hypothetical protein GSI_02796 [Ganoderma sinense ZZ0214-1]|uniref:Uncharacterized protein n=1 Tax=Ganoderma sinense ZZ0214-1 TaxID=1077348 RepID=A0A2G8SMN7_9APHY|nr:hypothetical protein GSI_02796 [Ganoderma sinense ZZ0214-1]